MKIRLVAFDVDATLADVGQAVAGDIAARIVNLERQGIQVLFNSGKSAFYLAGLARGLGVQRPLLVGENGCVILDIARLEETQLAVRPGVVDQLQKELLARHGRDIWLQPNQVALTIFPKDVSRIPMLTAEIREYLAPFPDPLAVVPHADAIDVFPEGTDKGRAMREVKQRYGYRTEEIVAVGDSATDLPMFEEAGAQVIVGKGIHFEGALSASTPHDAITLLEAVILHDR